LFPEEGDEDGWRCTGGGVLQLLGDDVVLQRIGQGEEFRGMRQGKIERIEERRGTGAHRRRRNCPGKSADLRISGDKLRRPGGFSGRRTKGRWRRREGAIYRYGAGKKRLAINRELMGRNYRGRKRSQASISV
jgi:hypothetical protein